MPTFRYEGKNSEGAVVHETVEAKDRFAVYDIARNSGHTVTTVEEMHGFAFNTDKLTEYLNALIGSVKLDEIIMFTRNLSAMLKAGLPMSRALSVAERQTKNQSMKSALKDINAKLNQGIPFHEAIAHHPKIFSRLYVSMVHAGEESGTLSEALATLSLQMERSSNLKKKIKGAMIYPMIIIGVMGIIGVLMMIFVIPTLTKTFTELNTKLPASTLFIMAVSDFFAYHSVLAIASIIGVIASIVGGLKTSWGKRAFEWVLVRLPVIGVMAKETNAARTARTLSSLLSSGVDVVQAITITTDVVQNSYYQEILRESAQRVEKGKPLSEIFIEREDLYPILVGEMIAVGEETGQISSMLEQVAIFYENEVERKTKDLSTIIEPLLMVFIGGAVGFFALAMISPIYSISDSIG